MIKKIRKVAVLGAGVMGSGIAAHLANAGIPTLMLDIVPPNPGPGDDVQSKAFRNRFAAGGLKKLFKARPAAVYSKNLLELIEVGNFDDDLHRVSECDWIVEVVKEDMGIKQSLFAKVDEYRKPGTIVSSNTSGLSIVGMTEGRSDDFRAHFLVTHFFNPVRYMKLLELVSGEETAPEVMAFFADFGEDVLGKGIVFGKDTTNFIANRIGTYGMMKIIEAAVRDGYSVEEIDKIFGPATGRPKSAVFRTADIVGLDTLGHVATNCYDSLVNDPERDAFKVPAVLKSLVEKGWLGSKSGQGFYKKSKNAAGKKEILSLNLKTMEYGPQAKVRIDSLGAVRKENDPGKRLKIVVNADDRAGKIARSVTFSSLSYSATLLGEIADDIVNIDRAMQWGFNWDLGPFESWDVLGVQETAASMIKEGYKVPAWVSDMLEKGNSSFYSKNESGEPTFYDPKSGTYQTVPRAKKELSLAYLKQTNSLNRVAHKMNASLWDSGDGVLVLEFHSTLQAKLHPVDDEIISMMHTAVDELEENFDALVIHHDGENFSAGANLMLLFMGAQAKQWDQIRKMVTDFQNANQRMRFSSKPVVAAPAGLALGGGAEIVLGANAVQAAAELYIGLVEVGMGLIPGGGGNLNLLRNLMGAFSNDKDVDPFPFLKKAFMAIGTAQVATSAEEGREKGFLRQTDGITLNRAFLLHAAKERALGMARAGFRAPQKQKFRLPGRDGAATIDMLLYSMVQDGHISEYDRFVGKKLAHVLTGGENAALNAPVTEDYLLELEQEAFLSLCGEEKTVARIGHFLQTKKPLRN